MTANIGRTLCLALVCATSTCAADDDDLFEEHHAHEHGVAMLDVAVDGPQLLLQFRSPAINMLGFEHAPGTAQENVAMARAMRLLSDPAAQFQPSLDARCKVTKADVTAPDWAHAHAEFATEYAFNCGQPAALKQLEVRLMDALDENMKLKVQVTSPQGQHSAELTRANRKLALRGRGG